MCLEGIKYKCVYVTESKYAKNIVVPLVTRIANQIEKINSVNEDTHSQLKLF